MTASHKPAIILIRGGGDLASGVAYRLYKAGCKIVITELPKPLAVRRLVSFSEAVYLGLHTVEGITARRARDLKETFEILNAGEIPVLVDPDAIILNEPYPLPKPAVLVDGRLTKQSPIYDVGTAELVIGLGPGFTASKNCHAFIETNRGHTLGRVHWDGTALPDTGIPDSVGQFRLQRVLRAPRDGNISTLAEIGLHYDPGQIIAEVSGITITAPFSGVLRGILRDGTYVTKGLKVGDIDPRDDPQLCSLISDKSLAIGGGVLEAIMSRDAIRKQLWV